MKRINFNDYALVFKLKSGKTEDDTIFRIGKNKAQSFRAKLAFMKKKNLDNIIDLVELATESKRELIRKRNYHVKQ